MKEEIFCLASKGMNNLRIKNVKTREIITEIDFGKADQEYRNERMRALNKRYPVNNYPWVFTP